MRFAIDIGHADGTGARGCGFEEHALCARIAAALKEILESFKLHEFRADIIDFPSCTNGADLAASVAAINAGQYDACISLHMDASENAGAHGAHVCCCSSAGQRMAEEIALRLCPQLPGRYEQVKKRPDLYFLRKTRPPAVLVECGFITNPHDAAWVDDHIFHVARAIALGLAAALE